MLARLTGLSFLISAFGLPMSASAQQPVLVENIHQGAAVDQAQPRLMTAAGSRVFFAQATPESGEELWVSDGSAAGTRQVKEIRPGGRGSNLRVITASGTQVFFSANDGEHGSELWITDGTETGTRMVADMSGSSEVSDGPICIKPFLKGVIFWYRRGWNLQEMWYTDGTEAGTTLIKTPFSGNWGEVAEIPSMAAGPNFYFSFSNGEGDTLWRTNGTAAGTVVLKNILPGEAGFVPVPLGTLSNTLLFRATRLDTGEELYKTNGTAKGTVLVKDIFPGGDSSGPDGMVAAGKKNYFRADNADETASGIFVTDGTSGGTKPVAVPMTMRGGGYCESIVGIGNTLLAHFYNQSSWPSTSSTLVAIDTRSHACTLLLETAGITSSGYINSLVSAGSRAFFTLTIQGRQVLWVTDGTVAGTVNPKDVLGQEGDGSCNYPLTAAGSQIFFTATRPGQGTQLWKSDGTSAGTGVVRNLITTDGDGDPQSITPAGTRLYFSADDGVHGHELWLTDGPLTGARLVKDIRPGASGSIQPGMVSQSGIVYFAADNGVSGQELWRSDGTEAGTWQVKDILPGPNGSSVSGLRALAGRVYFQATTPETGRELWVTDGTEAGTVLFANLASDTLGVKSSSIDLFTEADGWIYFAVSSLDSISARGIYRTDGTAESLTKISNSSSVETLFIRPPSTSATLYPSDTVVFFSTLHGSFRAVKYIRPGAEDVTVSEFNGSGQAPPYRSNEYNLRWQASGITYGLFLLSGMTYSSFGTETHLVSINNQFYYLKNANSELWRTGSNGDVRLLSSDVPIDPTLFQVEDGTLFFAQQTGNGRTRTLWQTRGTPANTTMIPGVIYQADPESDNPFMQRLGDSLYFPARSGTAGQELHALSLKGRLEVADVTDPATPVLLADGATLDIGVNPSRTLRLRNTGLLPLPSITLTHAYNSPFTITPESLPSLAPGAEITVTVSFSAFNAGTYTEGLHINLTGLSPHDSHDLNLSARRMGVDDPAVVWQPPQSQLVLAGQEATFSASFATASGPYNDVTWLEYGGANAVVSSLPPVSGSSPPPSITVPRFITHGLSATVVAAQPARYAAYHGTTYSPQAHLAVVTRAEENAYALLGQTARITCKAAAPEGSTLSYQWYRYGMPLGSFDRVRGSRSATLEIPQMQDSDLGRYECTVTLHAPDRTVSLSHGSTRLDILYPPEPLAFLGPTTYVGEEVSLQLRASLPVTRFTIKGLPPGLKMSATGLITGKPTKALPYDPKYGQPGPYRVTVTTTNAAGTGTPMSFIWTILPLLNAGTYEGLFERDGDLDGGKSLGSRIKITIATTGALSGQIQHHGKTYPFNRYTVSETSPYYTGFRAEFQVSRGKSLPPLTIVLPRKGPSSPSWQATLSIANQGSTDGFLRRSLLSNFPSSPPPPYAGKAFTVGLLSQPTLHPGLQPAGSGFLAVNISKTGVATWKGKLADGTAITGSATLSSRSFSEGTFIPVRQELYKGTGSLLGWIQVDYPRDDEVWLTGTLTWNKAPVPGTKERNYKDGIPVLDLTVNGQNYTAPKADMALWHNGAEGDAKLTVFGPGFPDAGVTNNITLNARHVVQLPPLSATAPVKTLTLDVKRGTFKGTVSLPHAENTALNRTTAFEGVILMDGTAVGYFLLPDLPAAGQPASALKTTPLKSCDIVIDSNPQ